MDSKAGFAALAFVVLAGAASAFTNGTLLPSYLCDLNSQAKGGPQSLAGVLPFLTEKNATQIVAQYHHLNVPPYTMAQDLCDLGTVPNATDKFGQKTFVVKAIDNTTTLVGLILWVQKLDKQGKLTQIGKFVDPGLNMIPYPYGCNGDLGQTIVHRTALQRNATIRSQSAPITWDINGGVIMSGEKAQVAGICITQAKRGLPGGGFGKFVIDMIAEPTPQNQGPPPSPSGKASEAKTQATTTASTTAPVAGTTAPVQATTVPVGSTAATVKASTAPMGGKTAPAPATTAPVQGKTPQGKATPPQKGTPQGKGLGKGPLF